MSVRTQNVGPLRLVNFDPISISPTRHTQTNNAGEKEIITTISKQVKAARGQLVVGKRN
jgi:hypothetical protein